MARTLSPELVERLRQALRKRGARRAIVFGSYARGNADAFSDLDLVVIAPSERPFIERFHDFSELWKLHAGGIELLVYTPEEWQDMLDRENGFAVTVMQEGLDIHV